METDPRRWLSALRKSHENLVTLVSGRSEGELESPSYCRGWPVAQVLSHLGSGAELTLTSLERILAGGPPLPREEFQPVWERWDNLGPQAQASQLVVWDRRCVFVFQGLDDATLEGMRLQMFGMDLDAASWLSLRLNEHTLHCWDVAVASDPDAELLPSSTELLVDRLSLMAGRLGKAEAATGPRRLEIHTTTPERQFVLEIGDGVALRDRSTLGAQGRRSAGPGAGGPPPSGPPPSGAAPLRAAPLRAAQPRAPQPRAAQPTAAQPRAQQPTAAQPTAAQPTAARKGRSSFRRRR